ncbi:MAG: DUF411 domain-containing protein [Gemmatimonadaceae bacterium]
MSKRANRRQGQNRSTAPSSAGGRLTSSLSRRAWLGIALGGAATALVGERWWRNANPTVIAADATPITVYASPSCACCQKWARHLEQNGFHVTVEKVFDVAPIKRQLGVPDSLWSCHTAMVHAYAIEGHVPADLIQRLTRERPAIAGIAVPGMPNGSPGMEAARMERYKVISFTRAGGTDTYAVR